MTAPARTFPSEASGHRAAAPGVFPLGRLLAAINRLSVDAVNRALTGDRLIFLRSRSTTRTGGSGDLGLGTIAAIANGEGPNGGIHIIVRACGQGGR
jgi:hypothetical protein